MSRNVMIKNPSLKQSLKQWFDSDLFRDTYHYEGPLGAFCEEDKTSFFLWAPTASRVELSLYPDGLDSLAKKTIRLKRTEKGVFSTIVEKNLDGCYYDYAVTVDGVTRRSGDPYAKACGVNGVRSMVIDLARTNPEGWEEDKAPKAPEENIIYEIHVRDFSASKHSGVKEEWRGKFLALTQEGTTLDDDKIHVTGLDYLKHLGITHVQLMPSYDYGSVDEINPENSYNWGYDPVNYNVPEGSYSTDPFHGEVRIRELKEAIMALHKNGIRVIMDVVYNHTYSLDSCLFSCVPWYYYRQNEDGSPCNGSGCGNDVATERSMCGRYIYDSILYWVKEYHIDGFRFDLMGLLDVPLMNKIQKDLDDLYGEKEKMIYGEPWSAASTNPIPGTIFADKKGLLQVHPKVGAFCDATRDAIKGDLQIVASKGLVNGGPISEALLNSCLHGWVGEEKEFSVQSLYQTINYTSVHDDWTLWDKLVIAMKEKPDFQKKYQDVLRANFMAVAMLCVCKGSLFFHAGEEFGRTKLGEKNTYASSIALNQLDWNRAWEYEELVNYYRGLLALRKQVPALCEKEETDVETTGWDLVTSLSKRCFVTRLKDLHEKSRWKEILLIVNAEEMEMRYKLPEEASSKKAGFKEEFAKEEVPKEKLRWMPLVDATDSFLWKKEEQCVADEVIIAPGSISLWGCRYEIYL